MDYISHKFPMSRGLSVIEDEVSAHLIHNFFDLVVDINDVTGNEIFVRFRGQRYFYSQSSVQFLLDSYIRLVKMCADMQPNECIDRPQLYDPEAVALALSAGLGEYSLLAISLDFSNLH